MDETMQGLASIGVKVKVNNVEMNYVQEISEMGGTPSNLDATCLKDVIKKSVPGVQDASSWEVTYLFDNTSASSDFRRLKALEKAGKSVPVETEYPDGTRFASSGYVTTYPQGTKVDELITAKLIINLQAEWTVTNPA